MTTPVIIDMIAAAVLIAAAAWGAIGDCFGLWRDWRW